MAENTQQDPFGQLPEELRIKIIKLSPNPFSLRNLAHASPAMGRVLDRYPLEIVEEVLEATVPVQTRRLMDAVLKARFSDFFASMPEAQTIAEADWVFATENIRSSGLDRAAAAVRSLLASAANVHAWSHACLEHLIRKSLQLRPSTLIKMGSGNMVRERFESAESRKDYIPQETGPPSYVEEKRMMESFWRLQFLLELQDAGRKGRLDAIWPREEIDTLFESSADGFYDVHKSVREQILTASDFLDAVTSGSIASVEAVKNNAFDLPTIRWEEGAVSRCYCAEPVFFVDSNKDIFNQDPRCEYLGPCGYLFWSRMSSLEGYEDGGPLTLVYPFKCWRKYGFAIWDDKRMADLGMRHPTKRSILRCYISYSFRWWSLLSEKELRQEFSMREQYQLDRDWP